MKNTPEAFCILSAGCGSRLGKYTRSINKALLPIDGKAAISHIIDKVYCDIVIAVGYESEKLIEYCLAAHSDKSITFVRVDDYSIGPGYSLQQCKSYLDRPFTLTTVDCLINGDYPPVDDWVGVAYTDDPKQYCTFDIKDDFVIDLSNKEGKFSNAFIGLCGIKSHELFWNKLKRGNDKEYELVNVFKDWKIRAIEVEWFDIGTPENYLKLKKDKYDFSKNDEITYKVNGKYIKLFNSRERVKSKINRCKLLSPHTPKLSYEGNYVYAYEEIPGNTLYLSDIKIQDFLDWCQKNLWIEVENPNFREWCRKFYYEKTIKRVSEYTVKYGDRLDLSKIDWNLLLDGKCVLFHGDLQFDNIIYNGEFRLIDWRESFDDSDYGDIYYDLAKLHGGILLPYSRIKNGEFSYSEDSYSFSRLSNEKELIDSFVKWVENNGYSMRKIRLLTALIYLNMAPLHHYPFDKLLFAYGKSLL